MSSIQIVQLHTQKTHLALEIGNRFILARVIGEWHTFGYSWHRLMMSRTTLPTIRNDMVMIVTAHICPATRS